MSKYGSLKAHALLAVTTLGIGNVAYALYRRVTYNEDDTSGYRHTGDDLLAKADGFDGQIAVTDNKVVISRSGALAKTQHGFEGDVEIWFDAIRGIDFKEGVNTGYIEVQQSGADNETVKFRSYGGTVSDFKEVKSAIEQSANQ